MDLQEVLAMELEAAKELAESLNSTMGPGGLPGAGGLKYLEDNVGVMVPYFVMLVLACFLGTFGNLLIISAIVSYKELRSVGNMFICNLAIADLCVSSFVDMFNIISVIEGESYFSRNAGLCEAVALVCLTSCFASLYSIGAVSFNRYVHIVHNSLYSKMFTTRNTVIMCIGIWIWSFVLDSPNVWGWGKHGYDTKTLTCLWDRTHAYSYTLFVAFIGIATPVVIISINYVLIFKHVLNSKKRVAAAEKKALAGQEGGLKKREKGRSNSMKLAQTLFIIFVVFAACWTPYAVVIVLDYNDTYPQEVHMFVILIAHVNSSCNFFLYGATNKQFRVAYFRLLGFYKCFPSLRERVEGGSTVGTMTAVSVVKAGEAEG